MKTFRFIFFTAITLTLVVALNKRIAGAPPLGKFMSPFHGFWQNAEMPGIRYQENLTFDGLTSPVTVYYDEIDIPHIYASNQQDLHFVQGYITARDRLWQMDFFSRLVFGRLSEVLGERALDYDRLNRRIGLKKMTYDFYQTIQKNPELTEMLQAYSDGVNAYIDDLSYSDYPLEFKLLNYEPEKWSPLKSCLAYAMLSNTLSKGESDLENTNAIELFGEDIFDLLYPDTPKNIDPVIPKGRKWDFDPIPATKPNINYPPGRTKQTIEKPHPLNGSNNFAVMGKKTKNGHVLLANEPDLELTLPSIWYAYHLHSPQQNVMGVTVPGTPIILIGFNDYIAWGVTNSPRDQVDWYAMEFKTSARNEYRYNNQWFKTEKIVEEIKVKDSKTVYDTIVYVHHGPVVYSHDFRGDSKKVNYAMKWIAHLPSTTFEAVHQVNKAENYEQFVEAMKFYTGPPQNFAFGSITGDIALWLPGKFPVKWEEQGKFLMSGANPSYEWSRYIPFDHLMHIKNPEKGFVSSANQHQVDSVYPYYVYDHNYEYYRNRRINDRLSQMNNITAEDLMKLQNDNFNIMASETLPMMLDSLDTATFTEREWNYRKILSDWDYFNDPDLKAPTLYQLWWDRLYNELWDEFDTVTVAINKPHRYTTIDLLKNNPQMPFVDILNTEARESVSDLLNLSYKEALDSLESWTSIYGTDYSWAKTKNTSINHILKLAPFSHDHVEIGGYSGIVNAASKGHGPSWRMVVELDPQGVKAWGVYPGSQTGNLGSPDYGKLINNWASGKYYELLFGQEIAGSEKIIFTQRINPTER